MHVKRPSPVFELTVEPTQCWKMVLLAGEAQATGRHNMCMSSKTIHCACESAVAALSPVGQPCYSKVMTELFRFNAGMHMQQYMSKRRPGAQGA